MRKIIAGIAIYGAMIGVMWRFIIYPLCKISQREDEWLERQSQRSRHEGKIPSESER